MENGIPVLGLKGVGDMSLVLSCTVDVGCLLNYCVLFQWPSRVCSPYISL